jgi:hypothetical protein
VSALPVEGGCWACRAHVHQRTVVVSLESSFDFILASSYAANISAAILTVFVIT